MACLEVDGGRVVKGVRLKNLRDAGDPVECATAHARDGADEIVLLDITAKSDKRGTLLDTVARTARSLFIPFTVGGGIRQLADAAAVFNAGADKVAINSAAVRDPELISQIAERFGSQAVVVAIDAKRGNGGFEVFVAGGRTATGRDAMQWAREAASRGAGEILLTSMDCDGTRAGFDCELTRLVSQAVSIPVIASGGAGSAADFLDVFRGGWVRAGLRGVPFSLRFASISRLKKQ